MSNIDNFCVIRNSINTYIIIQLNLLKSMLKAILITTLLALVFSQSFPCSNVSLTPINAQAMTNTTSISLAAGYNVVVGRWNNPIANQSYVINLYGWKSFNGSLIEAFFVPQNNTEITASVAFNQRGVLYSPLNGNSSYIFAQKDNSNAYFQIKVTSLVTLKDSSVGFSFSLYQGSYNNFYNSACDAICNYTVAFATVDGTNIPTQFVCTSSVAQEGFFNSIINKFLDLFQ